MTQSDEVICPQVVDTARGSAQLELRWMFCLGTEKQKKFVYGKCQSRGEILSGCNMFLSTLSGKSKDPRPHTHAPAPPFGSTFRQFLFLSLVHNVHTISSVYDTEDCDTSTAAPKLIYWNVNSERPRTRE